MIWPTIPTIVRVRFRLSVETNSARSRHVHKFFEILFSMIYLWNENFSVANSALLTGEFPTDEKITAVVRPHYSFDLPRVFFFYNCSIRQA